jgi:hypothetical protein
MKALIRALLVGIVIVGAVGIAEAAIWSGNGHEYQLVTLPGSSWDAATANLQANLGSDWYLATITSQLEQDWINSTFGVGGEYWLGGYQNPLTETRPAFGWTWVTGEPWAYTNWPSNGSEPNDYLFPGSDQYLALKIGVWNDEGEPQFIDGYIAERSVPEPSTLFLLGAGLAGVGLMRRRFKS